MNLLEENTRLKKMLVKLMDDKINPPLNEKHEKAIHHLRKISKRSKLYKNAMDAIKELRS